MARMMFAIAQSSGVSLSSVQSNSIHSQMNASTHSRMNASTIDVAQSKVVHVVNLNRGAKVYH